MKRNHELMYASALVRAGMKACPKSLEIKAKDFPTLSIITEFIKEYIDEKIIPRIKNDDSVYKPKKPYLRLSENEVNDQSIDLYKSKLIRFVFQRIVVS